MQHPSIQNKFIVQKIAQYTPVQTCPDFMPAKLEKKDNFSKTIFLNRLQPKHQQKHERNNYSLTFRGSFFNVPEGFHKSISYRNSKNQNKKNKLSTTSKTTLQKTSYSSTNNDFNTLRTMESLDIAPIIKEKEREKLLEIYTKKKLKGKLLKLMQDSCIMESASYNFYKMSLNDDIEERKKEKEKECLDKLQKKQIMNVITQKTTRLFKKVTPTNRFEDHFYTPNDFLKENFSKKERDILSNDPGYFGLNKPPFNKVSALKPQTLSKIINQEEEEEIKKEERMKRMRRNLKTKKRTNVIRVDNPKQKETSEIKPLITEKKRNGFLKRTYFSHKKYRPNVKFTKAFASHTIDCPLLNLSYDKKLRNYTEKKEETLERKKFHYERLKEAEEQFQINKKEKEDKKYEEKYQLNKILIKIRGIYNAKVKE